VEIKQVSFLYDGKHGINSRCRPDNIRPINGNILMFHWDNNIEKKFNIVIASISVFS